jgi:hypothetical protein
MPWLPPHAWDMSYEEDVRYKEEDTCMSYEEEDTCPGCLRTRGLTKLTKAFLLHVVMRLYHMYHMLHVVQRLYLYATCSK